MPYVALPLLEAALDELRGKHPLAVLVIPIMARTGVPVADSPEGGEPFGSEDELEALKTWFQIPGAPQGQPFRAIWEDNPSEFWRNERYAGRSLQRVRTDRVKRGHGFFQTKVKGQKKHLWALRPQAGSELLEERGYPVRIADLAIWYGREQDVANLQELVQWFEKEFPIRKADLVGTIYDDELPQHYFEIPFSPDPLTQSEYAEAVGAAPLSASLEGSLPELIDRLESCVTANGFISSPGFLARVVNAWAVGDIVVLVGLPGTGKTKFAHTVEKCLKTEFPDLTATWIGVRPDFEATDLLGYERLDGRPELREFARSVLKTDRPLGAHLVVLEEFNLGQVESYLAPLLIAIQHPDRRIGLPAGEEALLPQDALVLATCNSYLDEPESRLRLGFATKRRTSLITMPNVLYERFEKDEGQAIMEITLDMIAQERGIIAARQSLGLASAMDGARLDGLETVKAAESIAKSTWERWIAMCTVLLSSPEGKEFLTVGLVRDVALALAYSDRSEEAEARALGRAAADKIVHQLRGPKARADEFLDALGDVPNRAEVVRLIDRMKSSPGDELIALV